MKQLTVLDLATILQLDEPVKENLRKNFEQYNDGLKFDILSILWDGVHELKERMAKLKYEQFLLEVDDGKRELKTDLYQEAIKATWQDFDDILTGKQKELAQIEEIKAKLNLPSAISDLTSSFDSSQDKPPPPSSLTSSGQAQKPFVPTQDKP